MTTPHSHSENVLYYKTCSLCNPSPPVVVVIKANEEEDTYNVRGNEEEDT
jgi:hypothetical protein